jgi:hypothetical protein
MVKVFTPKVLRPPNPKSIPCKRRPKNMTGKAAHPSIRPINPLKIRWVELGPMLIWNRDATKKTADKMATFGVSSSLTDSNPFISPPRVRAAPLIRTGADRIPSEMCMIILF